MRSGAGEEQDRERLVLRRSAAGADAAIGGQWIYNREYRSLEQDMATLKAVTPHR